MQTWIQDSSGARLGRPTDQSLQKFKYCHKSVAMKLGQRPERLTSNIIQFQIVYPTSDCCIVARNIDIRLPARTEAWRHFFLSFYPLHFLHWLICLRRHFFVLITCISRLVETLQCIGRQLYLNQNKKVHRGIARVVRSDSELDDEMYWQLLQLTLQNKQRIENSKSKPKERDV